MRTPPHHPAQLLLAFRRESRITPSMPPLLVHLAAITPAVSGLSAGARIGATTVALTVILAATGNRTRRLALLLLYLLGILWSQHAIRGGRHAYHRLIPRDHCRITAQVFITGNPVPPDQRGTSHPVEVRRITLRGRWKDCTGRVLARFDRQAVLTHGQAYVVSGILSPAPRDSFGLHLLSREIRHLLDIREARLLCPPQGPHRLLARIYRLRDGLGPLLTSGMTPATGNLYQSMLLGRRDLFPRETKIHFLRSATLHIFAISGLHVHIIHVAILFVLKCLGLGRFLQLAISCLCGLLYIVITGATPSSVRAGIMLMLFLIPQLLRRPPNIRHSICLAALLELTLAPLYLLHCGFLFSFVIVAALIYSAPMMESLKGLILERWAWVPVCEQKHRALKWPGRCWNQIAPLGIAWLVSLPIAMHLNGIVSLGGLAIGIPAQLLALCLVAGAVPKLILAMICPPLSTLLGLFMDLAMKALVALAQWGGSQSLCIFRPQAAGAPAALFLVICFILICHGWRIPTMRWAAGACITAWLIMTTAPQADRMATVAVARGPEGGDPALCLITRGQAQAVLLTTGNEDSARLLFRQLAKRGVTGLHTCCLSDLTGKLARHARMARERESRHVVLAQRQQATPPEELNQLTADGTYLRRQPGTRGRQRADFHGGTLRLRRTAQGTNAAFHGKQIRITLSPLPDGNVLIIARTPEDAETALIPPGSKGTFRMLTLRLNTNPEKMLY